MGLCRYSPVARTTPTSSAKTLAMSRAWIWLIARYSSLAFAAAITTASNTAGINSAHHGEVENDLRASEVTRSRISPADQAARGTVSRVGADITGPLPVRWGRGGRDWSAGR